MSGNKTPLGTGSLPRVRGILFPWGFLGRGGAPCRLGLEEDRAEHWCPLCPPCAGTLKHVGWPLAVGVTRLVCKGAPVPACLAE